MKRWEYLKEKNLLLKDLDKFGNEGWELITIHQIGNTVFYYFKRPY